MCSVIGQSGMTSAIHAPCVYSGLNHAGKTTVSDFSDMLPEIIVQKVLFDGHFSGVLAAFYKLSEY